LLTELQEVITTVTRLVPTILNPYSIIYLASKKWSSLGNGDRVVYRTTDAVGNPTILELSMSNGAVMRVKVVFKYMGRFFEAIYPADRLGKSIDDPLLKEVSSRIGGEACVVRVGDVEYQAACRAVGKGYVAIRPLEASPEDL